MTAKPMFVAVASALVVAGCATGGFHTTEAKDCRGSGVCKIDVTVDNCRITVADPINVYDGAKEIHWDIKTDNYSFPADGIFIKNDPGGQADDLRRLNDKTFKLHDKNSSDQTKIDYGIKVLHNNVPCSPPLDPGIINHG